MHLCKQNFSSRMMLMFMGARKETYLKTHIIYITDIVLQILFLL